MATILADHEFEPLRAEFPILNTAARDEHVPGIERTIRTIKDSTRSTYRLLPFRRIPRLILNHLVRNAVFWLNAFPVTDGVSSQYSPRYLILGFSLEFNKHVCLEFGAYVQTHEEHNNNMSDRTVGAICLGPTGNIQGGHYFMSLATGERIIRHRWTPLPMPREVIDRVSNFGHRQHMPLTLTFADRHGHILKENFDDFHPDDFPSDDDNDSDYSDSDPSDDSDDDDNNFPPDNVNSNSPSESSTIDTDPTIHPSSPASSVSHSPSTTNSSPVSPEPQPAKITGMAPSPSSISSSSTSSSRHMNLVRRQLDYNTNQVEGHDESITISEGNLEGDDGSTTGMEDKTTEKDGEITGMGGRFTGMDETSTEPGQEETIIFENNDNNQANNQPLFYDMEEDNNSDIAEQAREQATADNDVFPTEEEQFRQAAEYGAAQASSSQTGVRRSLRLNKGHPWHGEAHQYLSAMVDNMSIDSLFLMYEGLVDEIHAFLTPQMTAKKGLKVFGEKGALAIIKELDQLIQRKVMKARRAGEMTRSQKENSLKYLMFLKEKRCGKIKGRGCADGRKQRLWKTKEETSSPTISTEALFLMCLIIAKERRYVLTLDIPGAFMQSDIDEELHVKLEGEIADLLVRRDPSYKEYITKEKGKTVIYAQLEKALYGTLQAAALFWKDLTKFIVEDLGFVVNQHDLCVANKTINGQQCTIGWHVDDLMISHAEKNVVHEIVEKLQVRFGKEAPLVVHTGKEQDYLGMMIDFSEDGKVKFKMHEYVQNMLDETPEELMKGPCSSPAANHLFEVNPDAEKLNSVSAETFHHLTAKLLYLAKRSRPDVLPAVSFLCTRVQSPDVDDWKKLGRCMRFINETKKLYLTLEADDLSRVRWWIDASFGVHPDMKSHTGATMMIGKGSVYSMSTKQKVNTRSSTEAELVGVNDAIGTALWVKMFMEEQGYKINDNIIYQDNQSAMLLERNGRKSSSKKTRHMDLRYYFITDQIKNGKVRVAYCPTDDMIGDFMTKPLQGSKFNKFQGAILNLPGAEKIPAPGEIHVNNFLHLPHQ